MSRMRAGFLIHAMQGISEQTEWETPKDGALQKKQRVNDWANGI